MRHPEPQILNPSWSLVLTKNINKVTWGWTSTLRIHAHILTHWGRVTHICVSKLTIIGSDNGLSPERRQAIIWTNAGILLIGPLGTNFGEILIEIQTFSLKKIRLKMSSAKCCSFCLDLNVLITNGGNPSKLLYSQMFIKFMIRHMFIKCMLCGKTPTPWAKHARHWVSCPTKVIEIKLIFTYAESNLFETEVLILLNSNVVYLN